MGTAEVTGSLSLRELPHRLHDDHSMREVVAALRAGQSGTIDGAWGSSKALALAALASTSPSLLVAVLPHPGDLDAFASDLRTFLGKPIAVFPALENAEGETASLASREAFGKRLAIIKTLQGPTPPRLIVTTIQALMQPTPTPGMIARHSRRLAPGTRIEIDELIRWLEAHDWKRRDAVELPGEYSLRGGILDVFPTDALDPVRIEFFGDSLDSMRRFSVESQRSLGELDSIDLTALDSAKADDDQVDGDLGHFTDCVAPDAWFALVEPLELKEEGKRFLDRFEDVSGFFSVERCWARLISFPTVVVASLPFSSMETTCSLRVESVERLSGEVAKLKDELDHIIPEDQLVIACHNEAESRRLQSILAGSKAAEESRLHLEVGAVSQGFRWVTTGVVLLSDNQLFHRTEQPRAAPKRRLQGRAIDSFLELHEGDYVVHLAHGIGVFRGMKMLDKNGQLEEHLCLEFADKVLVYVPASKIELVQKYVGSSQAPPTLSKIGGVSWERKKRQVQNAVLDLASDLIDVQASRQTVAGIACPPDSEWQRQFEASFPYRETDDQLTAMEEIRHDMEAAKPMDRLICGDVGYGKTELAMRAAFKAVDFGKQVAILVPTTVLAQQHWRSFRERMAEFPFSIEVISRFQTKGEQKETLNRTKEGAVDILIGTHRLLSADVAFNDLGLVIVDEEQRFGVAHKERLKLLRTQVDVLTLTATPIPRTLHSALLGIRDISNLETAPENRMAVETRVTRFDPVLVRHAIMRELNRDGQVYFVHNRVHDIKRVVDKLAEIVPEARVAIVHGQMPEHEIEEGMVAFIERRADILIATTIIESGLDIPNSNTIFINEGDHYGLADMHQLRGRVGRSSRRAYCYVLVDEHKMIKPDAQRRLKAIEEYSALGSGFQIALRDLEIRGAGNILGTEQSGHIAAVGYELYCQLLENAVRSIKKQPLRTILDVTIELPWMAYFPAEYLPGERFRIDSYRRLARIRELGELAEFERDLVDRFGPIPDVARNLINLAELRILAHIWQVEAIRPDGEGHLVFSYRHRSRIETLARLRQGQIIVADAKSVYLKVPEAERTGRGYSSLLKRILQPA